MNVLRVICFFSVLSSIGRAILPLPYPIDPSQFRTEEPVQTKDFRTIQGFAELYSGSQLREMELPHFESGRKSLGYSGPDTFLTPPALRPRVDFWKRIYSQYTTSQAVLHDSKHLEIVYEVIELGDILNNPKLSERRKRALVNARIREKKREIRRQLLALDAVRDNPLKIPLELFELFKKFKNVRGDDRFLIAATQVRSQSGQRDRIVRGFFYGGRYFSQMMGIFDEYGLPRQLTRLTLVESAFDIAARSKVGASGVWQFTRGTGKRYLRINRAVDERNDPLLATHAAAKLLTKNFTELGVWPLAITAYNHGRAGMRQAIEELSTRDIARIISDYRSETFGFASSNFYASFLAILEVEADYRSHFGKLMVDSPVQLNRLALPRDITLNELVGLCGLDREELLKMNLAITDWAVSNNGLLPQGYPLALRTETTENCKRALSER